MVLPTLRRGLADDLDLHRHLPQHDLKGWQKVLWVVLVLVLPLFGILAYLIARGDKLRARQQQAQLDEQAVEEFLARRHGSSGATSPRTSCPGSLT